MATAPHPNPHVGIGGATFGFTLPAADPVRIGLFDARSRLAAARPFEWIDTVVARAIRWEPASLAAGTYIVHFVRESGHVARAKWTFMR